MSDIIDTLAGLDDAALTARLGFSEKLKEAKADIVELSKLSGDARASAAERVTKLLNPSIYTDELGWIADSAKRRAQSAGEAMCNCDPSDLMDD